MAIEYPSGRRKARPFIPGEGRVLGGRVGGGGGPAGGAGAVDRDIAKRKRPRCRPTPVAIGRALQRITLFAHPIDLDQIDIRLSSKAKAEVAYVSRSQIRIRNSAHASGRM